MDQLSTIHENLRSTLFALGSSSHDETADTGNGRQCLTPKTKRGNCLEIVRFLYFAGGVTFKGKHRLIRKHAMAIVLDPQIRFASIAILNLNFASACIETIFH